MKNAAPATAALLLAAAGWTLGLAMPDHPLSSAIAALLLAGVAILVLPGLLLGRHEQAVDMLAEAKAAGVEPERLLSAVERVIEEEGERPRKIL